MTKILNQSSPFILSLTFLFIIFMGEAYSQTIDSLIAEAIRNNPQLKSLESRINASEFRTESINSYPAPNLGIEFSQIPVDNLNPVNGAISNSVSVSQMFPIGGKLKAMTEVEKRNVLVSRNEYDIYKVKLTSQLKMSYYNLWLQDRKIEVQKGTIDLLNQLIKSVDYIYQVNRITQADVLTLRSEIASNKSGLLILESQRETEIYNINKLLGRDLDSKAIYPDRDIVLDSLTLTQEQLEDELVVNNPSLQRMESMIGMNKAMITANNKELIPDLMLQGMLMRMPQGMILTSKSDLSMLAMETPKTDYMISFMASVNLPFAPWSVNKYSAKEKELYSGIRGIEYEKNDMKRDMISGLKRALVQLKTSEELRRVYSTEIIPMYQQSTESQVAAYQNNRANINSVLDSYRMLLMQQMNYYMAQADYQMAIAEIEMMLGKEL